MAKSFNTAKKDITGDGKNADGQLQPGITYAELKESFRLKQLARQQKIDSLRSQMAVKARIARALGSELTSLLVIMLITGIVYFAVFVAYLWTVHLEFTFLSYYPQFSTLQPGPLVDQSLNIFWFCLFFSLFRLPMGLTFIWLMRRLGISWKINVFVVIGIGLFVLELFTMITSLVLYWFCNNPYWATNMCNDPRYPEVYGNDYPDYFPVGSFTNASADILVHNEGFMRYLYFNGAFLGLDVLLFIQIPGILDFKTNSHQL